MKKILLILSIQLVFVGSFVHAQNAITCSDTAFLFQGTMVTSLYGLNLATGTVNLIKADLIPSSPNQLMNAFGYNRLDNFLYGYRKNTQDICQIGAAPYTVTFHTISALPVKSFNVGDIDANGILYLYQINDTVIFRVDLSTMQLLNNVHTQRSLISDWVFSPVDGNIYAVDSLHSVFRFHPSTGQRDSLGQATGSGMTTTSAFGAQFIDSLGNLFLADNLSGKIFEIAAPHTGNTTPVFLSQGTASTINDGAFCRGAIVTAVKNLVATENLSVTVYPNPAFDKLNVETNSVNKFEIILYDATARKLLQKNFSNALTLNIEDFAKGLYFYEVRDKNGTIKKEKFIKE